MKLVSSAAQVRELDRRVIQDLGVPGVALMELASRAVAEQIARHHETEARRGVLVVCGGGNNGGDGYGVARWLHGWGFPVEVLSLEEQSRGDAAVLRAVCARMGLLSTPRGGLGDRRAGLLVDAVFGTGLDRKVTGHYAEILRMMRDHPAPVVAVDIPSGLSADTGQVLGVCVPAVRTVTFGRLKPGLLFGPGARHAGVVEVADIGLQAAPGAEELAVAEIPEPSDLAGLVPRRQTDTHKTREGKLLVIAGSTWMAGAAVLACQGALAAGVGLVTLLAPRGALPRLAALPPEVMLLDGGEGDVLSGEEPDLTRFDALAVGPGLGGGAPLPEETQRWLQGIWASVEKPAVFDADALVSTRGVSAGPRVITPHPGEAARMLHQEVEAVEADRLSAARDLARGRVALLKGPRTLVAAPGHRTSVNPTGNAILASGGTGDVLTGLVGGLLARGLTPRDAARVGAWVHGRAADLLAAERSHGWTSQDVARALPEAFRRLGTQA